jgi:hypothetical protein
MKTTGRNDQQSSVDPTGRTPVNKQDASYQNLGGGVSAAYRESPELGDQSDSSPLDTDDHRMNKSVYTYNTGYITPNNSSSTYHVRGDLSKVVTPDRDSDHSKIAMRISVGVIIALIAVLIWSIL